MDETITQKNILEAAKLEFLEKGFLAASLRSIVKNAGVTTGAFYGYYSSKEALFAAIVEPHAAAVMGRFMKAQEDFANLPLELQPEQMGTASVDCVSWMIDYVYEHFDIFKLIICHSEGTPYANFIHTMVEVEVESTFHFIHVLRSLGRQVPDIDPQLCHMICSGMFNGLFEMVTHDMPVEKAHTYVSQLQEFYTAGWAKLMQL